MQQCRRWLVSNNGKLVIIIILETARTKIFTFFVLKSSSITNILTNQDVLSSITNYKNINDINLTDQQFFQHHFHNYSILYGNYKSCESFCHTIGSHKTSSNYTIRSRSRAIFTGTTIYWLPAGGIQRERERERDLITMRRAQLEVQAREGWQPLVI